RGRVADAIADPERAGRLPVGRSAPPERGAQERCELLRPLPAAGVVRQPREREDRVVACRHDVGAEPRAPNLDERRMLPAGRMSALHPRVDREERGPGHAVLQAGPRGAAQGTGPGWKPLVERADAPPEAEYLGAGEIERRPRHRPQTIRPDGSRIGP